MNIGSSPKTTNQTTSSGVSEASRKVVSKSLIDIFSEFTAIITQESQPQQGKKGLNLNA